MARTISDTILSKLSAFLAKEMGLYFPNARWDDLERGVVAAAKELGRGDTAGFIDWLTSAPLTRRQIEQLAGFLTVGETYFFRDPRTLEVLESEILPSILAPRRGGDQHLRIWSAGCSSGEEAFTLAILLHRLLPDLRQWKINILATDINRAALARGMAGLYGKWSFRATPSWFKTLYFKPEGDELRVADHIRRMVRFEYLNLAEDSYPSLPTNTNAMDLIFCRNVLMYFSPETAHGVVEKLQKCLVEKGWLVVGPAEGVAKSVASLQPMSIGGVICYRKRHHEEEGRPRLSLVSSEAARPVVEPGEAPEEPAHAPFTEAAQGAPEPDRPAPAPSDGGPPPATEKPASSYPEAALLYRQGLYPQAAEMLTDLQARGELPPEALALLIRAQANQGRLPAALSVCDEALKERKLEPALHYLRAEILQEQGRADDARLALQRALYLDPGLVLAHFALGNLTLWTGKPERACKHFGNALALLETLEPESLVPGSEGMTAGRLREIIASMSSCATREGRAQ